jgi:predicted Zn-dependent protease
LTLPFETSFLRALKPEQKAKLLRRIFFALIACGVLLVVGYAGFRRYAAWREGHLLSMARAFAAKSDRRSELLSLEEILRVYPWNVEATRMVAEDADAHESPEALLWRERVVELAPHSTNDRLALAQTALRWHNLEAARRALADMGEAEKNTVAYHSVAGAISVAAGQWPEAESHFSEACRLEPGNPAPRLSLAVVQLRETNHMAGVEARNTLQSLAANPTNAVLRCQAMRELIVDDLRRSDFNPARAMAAHLIAETNSIFTDRLLRLEILRQTQDPEFAAELGLVREKAANDPGKVQQLGMWQAGKLPPEDSLAWLRSLPQDVRTNESVALLIAESCVTVQDWGGLQGCVEKAQWGQLESVRHAFLARSLRGQGLELASKGEWNKAVELCHDKNSLVTLLRLAAQWNWSAECQDILHGLVNQYPNEKWAEQELAQLLFAGGQSRSLIELYNQEIARSPSDIVAKGNLALIALLLNATELRPAEMARELYQVAPTNPSIAAAYALSLQLQKKPAEAVKVMDALNPQELENPSVAAYYGIFLQTAGNSSKARRYLELGSNSPMLPEERKLWEQARAAE